MFRPHRNLPSSSDNELSAMVDQMLDHAEARRARSTGMFRPHRDLASVPEHELGAFLVDHMLNQGDAAAAAAAAEPLPLYARWAIDGECLPPPYAERATGPPPVSLPLPKFIFLCPPC